MTVSPSDTKPLWTFIHFAALDLVPLRRIAHVDLAHKECYFVPSSDTDKVSPQKLAKEYQPFIRN